MNEPYISVLRQRVSTFHPSGAPWATALNETYIIVDGECAALDKGIGSMGKKAPIMSWIKLLWGVRQQMFVRHGCKDSEKALRSNRVNSTQTMMIIPTAVTGPTCPNITEAGCV